jgi:hypothetical protein
LFLGYGAFDSLSRAHDQSWENSYPFSCSLDFSSEDILSGNIYNFNFQVELGSDSSDHFYGFLLIIRKHIILRRSCSHVRRMAWSVGAINTSVLSISIWVTTAFIQYLMVISAFNMLIPKIHFNVPCHSFDTFNIKPDIRLDHKQSPIQVLIMCQGKLGYRLFR